MKGPTEHNTFPQGPSALVRGASASARHFAPEGREHIQFDHFANSFKSSRPALAFAATSLRRNSSRAPVSASARLFPFLPCENTDHFAHLSLLLRSFLLVADKNLAIGAFQIDGKIFQTTGA
jgi:hypothetical protein